MMVVPTLTMIKRSPMRIRTLLNDCQKFKSFVYQKEYMETIDGKMALVIEIAERKNSRPICSCCEKSCSQYDLLPKIREDQFVPLWGFIRFIFAIADAELTVQIVV